MTDITMDCFGSLIIYDESKGYCSTCPLKSDCETEVSANRIKMEEALGQPVYEDGGRFWLGAKRQTQQRAALAHQLSSATVAVSAPPRRAAPVVTSDSTITPFEASKVEGLPVKVRAALEKWVQKGISPEAICAGVNPFASVTGLKFQTLLADVINARGMSLTKSQLRAAIAQEMERRSLPRWADASLQSNINIAVGAFAACGIQIVKENS